MDKTLRYTAEIGHFFFIVIAATIIGNYLGPYGSGDKIKPALIGISLLIAGVLMKIIAEHEKSKK